MSTLDLKLNNASLFSGTVLGVGLGFNTLNVQVGQAIYYGVPIHYHCDEDENHAGDEAPSPFRTGNSVLVLFEGAGPIYVVGFTAARRGCYIWEDWINDFETSGWSYIRDYTDSGCPGETPISDTVTSATPAFHSGVFDQGMLRVSERASGALKPLGQCPQVGINGNELTFECRRDFLNDELENISGQQSYEPFPDCSATGGDCLDNMRWRLEIPVGPSTIRWAPPAGMYMHFYVLVTNVSYLMIGTSNTFQDDCAVRAFVSSSFTPRMFQVRFDGEVVKTIPLGTDRSTYLFPSGKLNEGKSANADWQLVTIPITKSPSRISFWKGATFLGSEPFETFVNAPGYNWPLDGCLAIGNFGNRFYISTIEVSQSASSPLALRKPSLEFVNNALAGSIAVLCPEIPFNRFFPTYFANPL